MRQKGQGETKKKMHSLFKEQKKTAEDGEVQEDTGALEHGSVEYWNAERAKLGLKPLKP